MSHNFIGLLFLKNGLIFEFAIASIVLTALSIGVLDHLFHRKEG